MPVLIAALLAASVPSQAAPAKNPAAAIARRVQRHYERIKDFSARFAQTSTYPTFGNVKNATGKVFLQKPVLLRWQYDDGRLLIIDGKELWSWNPEDTEAQVRRLSRGYVLARSPDPQDQAAINPRYLAEDSDRRAMIGGLRFLRRMFAAPALAKYVVAEKLPGPGIQSDDELLDYARANGSTVYHASCSCKMGSDETAVVDDQLRVHGIESLRVIDASVMPAVTSTNTNAPTIMIAEKGAAMVKAAAREKMAA